MDKYDASHDHYCYPASSVLKNKLNIQEMAALVGFAMSLRPTAWRISSCCIASYFPTSMPGRER